MYYFASDMHLGLRTEKNPIEREKRFVRWLDTVSADAKEIYLVGDVFDFWFEYYKVVPQGFTRTLGKIAELTDRGIKVHFFAGNHDLWIHKYLETECGMTLHKRPEMVSLAGKTILVAHGDNIRTQGQPMLRLMNSFFRSHVARELFTILIHPDLAMRFGHWWSSKSRKAKAIKIDFKGEDEFLVSYAREWLRAGVKIDYFVFGHIHCAADYKLSPSARALFLGEWIESPHYAVLDEQGNMTLKAFE